MRSHLRLKVDSMNKILFLASESDFLELHLVTDCSASQKAALFLICLALSDDVAASDVGLQQVTLSQPGSRLQILKWKSEGLKESIEAYEEKLQVVCRS